LVIHTPTHPFLRSLLDDLLQQNKEIIKIKSILILNNLGNVKSEAHLNVKGREVKAYSVGINKPLVPKTDTKETENLDKAISLDQEGASICTLQLSKHTSTKWLTVAPPYIPDAVVPAPHLGFVQVKGSQSPLIG
jgi:hypothetical protein